ncbi:PP2C family protein-serine/threonine phosphatase [Arthrobacter cryoconiti]|uniref:PP2C family protein-serine/threonine phosphatase n=1 Tax=Arthrobacter cryoconiti TaxID=748907 RepID=A0ABV8R6D4_9MICC|nr:protein phosphatase 2C domain-containing protein [Arthrobacter cryoconiti]MCC9067086.1 protein phosphatase 2C domain-containing protein [Arthrobacter cryoconiti]
MSHDAQTPGATEPGSGVAAPEASATAVSAGVGLSFGFGSDRGLRRELNEDSFLACDPIFAVADGMGGHEAGEVASRECISVLSRQPALIAGSRTATAADLATALRQADSRIREVSAARAGTTVTGVTLVEERGVPYWLVFNVGDSRTYRLSQGELAQVSVDHSEVQELVDGGYITPAEALVHPRRHVVTRALGTGNDTEADYWLVPVVEGDRMMVCSDGLTNEVTDDQIHRALSTLSHPQDAVDSLIQSALRSGGRDNVTVVVVDASNVRDGDNGQTHSGRAGESTAEDTLPRIPRIPVDDSTDETVQTLEASNEPVLTRQAETADTAEPFSPQNNFGDDIHG